MLCLNSIARQKFFIALETKSLLKILKNPPHSAFKFHEITSQSLHNRSSCRCFSNQKANNELVKTKITGEVSANRSIFETVKETTKIVTYSGIIFLGLGIAGVIFYTLFKELFSGKSASNIYSKALDRCLKNEKVVLSLGEPIKAFGEESSRGRRRHTDHVLYKKDGITYMRMKFFLKGSRKKATVHLEMVENESSNYDYRYLFVQLDEYPYTTIVLEDNRGEKAAFLQSQETMQLT